MKKSLTLLSAMLLLGLAKAQTPSLIGCYPLNSNAQDGAGSYHGTSTNVTYYPSQSDSVVEFKGQSGSNIKLPVDAALRPAKITIALWIQANNTANTQYILFHKNDQSSNHEGLALTLSGGNIVVSKNDPGNSRGTMLTGSNLAQGNWRHVAITFDGDTLRLYENGNLEAKGASSFPIVYDNTKGFVLGESGESFSLPFSGSVDNFRIYDGALSDAEISTLYTKNPGCGKRKQNQGNFYMSLTGNAADSSGNGKHATGTNTNYGTDISGKAGRAAELDGKGYFTMASGLVPSGITAFNVSLWFNTSEKNRPNGLAWAGSVTVGNTPTNYTPIMWLDSNGYLNGFLYDGSVISPKSTMKLNDGK